MAIRKIFFWLHLAAGIVAGSVILAMCVTSAALGFEKQIVHWAQRHERTAAASNGAQLLSMDALLAQALQHTGEAGGPLGQSIASAASLGGVFLAGTGISLAIRRFLGFWSKAKHSDP